MRYPIVFLALWYSLIGSIYPQTGPEADQDFDHSVPTLQKPWTQRPFKNDPLDFQFAIVSDRSGGMRPGVFPRAVARLNEMQPEFVISVGDLIAGGNWQRDEKEIRRQWQEFNGFAERFEMPFFYLPGNHDVSNALMDRIWDEMFGVRYYSFTYKNVLFLCLNTQDGESTRPYLGEQQIAWAQRQLAEHDDVRWTIVFIHQPLWLTEEGIRRNINGKPVIKKSNTGWPQIEAALAGRDHTVYAGHVHRYTQYERNEANYYTLGTTGGGSALRGSVFGEFDHATWITMSDKGPRMINLTLDGMLPDDASTEAKQKFWRSIRFEENFTQTYPFENQTLTLSLENPLDTPLTAKFLWLLPATDHWTVSPRRDQIELQPGEKQQLTFTANHQGTVSTYFPLPKMHAHFQAPDQSFHLERMVHLPLDLTEHVKKHPEKMHITKNTAAAPEIDGRLDDPLWQSPPTVSRLIPRQADGYMPVDTQAWLSYDTSHLYLGVHCEEPIVRDLQQQIATPDGDVWEDDSIEFFLDTNNAQKTYYHFAINPKGTLYDATQKNPKWNSHAKVAATIQDESWSIEMAIPLKDLKVDTANLTTWRGQIVRHHYKAGEKKTYQWSPTFWYANQMPQFYGKISLQ